MRKILSSLPWLTLAGIPTAATPAQPPGENAGSPAGSSPAGSSPAGSSPAGSAELLVLGSSGLSPAMLYSLHSPPKVIGELAARDHIGRLLLSHLSPAVDENREAVGASIATHYAGPVAFASDGLRVRP